MKRPLLQHFAQSPHSRHLMVSLVALCLLMQSVLAFLVTPMTVTHNTDEDSVTIVLCTLQGTRSITVDMPAFATDEGDICPALELNHIAGSANISAPPPVLSMIPVAVPVLARQPVSAHRTLHYAAFSSRAPPSLV